MYDRQERWLVMNPIDKLDFYKNIYTKKDYTIYEYIKKHPNSITRFNVEMLAKEIPASKAAIIRFSKKIGYKGFSEFKFEMTRYIVSGGRENENENMNTVQSITSLYAGFIKQINEFVSLDDVIFIAKEIVNARHVKIFGQNRSYTAAMQFRHRLAKIGYDAEAIRGLILFDQIIDYLEKDDLIIFFTTQARSKFYKNYIKKARKNGVAVIIISCAQTALLNEASYSIILPSISDASESSFLDNQALFFVFIEILLAEIAYRIQKN